MNMYVLTFTLQGHYFLGFIKHDVGFFLMSVDERLVNTRQKWILLFVPFLIMVPFMGHIALYISIIFWETQVQVAADDVPRDPQIGTGVSQA
jgi:hypothetical protein